MQSQGLPIVLVSLWALPHRAHPVSWLACPPHSTPAVRTSSPTVPLSKISLRCTLLLILALPALVRILLRCVIYFWAMGRVRSALFSPVSLRYVYLCISEMRRRFMRHHVSITVGQSPSCHPGAERRYHGNTHQLEERCRRPKRDQHPANVRRCK